MIRLGCIVFSKPQIAASRRKCFSLLSHNQKIWIWSLTLKSKQISWFTAAVLYDIQSGSSGRRQSARFVQKGRSRCTYQPTLEKTVKIPACDFQKKCSAPLVRMWVVGTQACKKKCCENDSSSTYTARARRDSSSQRPRRKPCGQNTQQQQVKIRPRGFRS